MFQSTHPLGVRPHSPDNRFANLCFNPRTHSGCDAASIPAIGRPSSFNPRTHSGCDRFHLPTFASMVSFNPRTHSGCDAKQLKFYSYLKVSIHAPTRGATRFHLPTFASMVSFNPRTHSGCDFPSKTVWSATSGFNPRTHSGCDKVEHYVLMGDGVSIHAPTRGATR